MNAVRALGYLGLTTMFLEDWGTLGEMLGGEVVRREDRSQDLRLDGRAWRVRISPGDQDDLGFSGWEVADDTELEQLVGALGSRGHTFREADAAQAADRLVHRLFTGVDPDGNVLELFHSPVVSGRSFRSPYDVGFETALGVGHMVLYCADVEAMLDFYIGGLGLRLTDTIDTGTEFLYFLRCNERHHSLALVPGRAKFVLQHIMLEVTDVDAVGAAFDRCSDSGVAQSTIGRHSNDEMLSFYAMAPGGYTVEYGCGARLIDEAAHRGARYTATSWWGHRDIRSSR